MRISDWSSDVCSSDLLAVLERPDEQAAGLAPVGGRARLPLEQRGVTLREAIVIEGERLEVRPGRDLHPDARGVSLFLLGLCPRLCLGRSEEHTSELQSLMRISYAVFCLKKQK